MLIELQIFIGVICMIGCSYTSWKIGQREGIETALDWLEDQGVIHFDTD